VSGDLKNVDPVSTLARFWGARLNRVVVRTSDFKRAFVIASPEGKSFKVWCMIGFLQNIENPIEDGPR
jgi:hypothetical protein